MQLGAADPRVHPHCVLGARNTRSAAARPEMLEALGISVDSKVAAKLRNSSRCKLYFACKDAACRPNGLRDAPAKRERPLCRQRAG